MSLKDNPLHPCCKQTREKQLSSQGKVVCLFGGHNPRAIQPPRDFALLVQTEVEVMKTHTTVFDELWATGVAVRMHIGCSRPIEY